MTTRGLEDNKNVASVTIRLYPSQIFSSTFLSDRLDKTVSIRHVKGNSAVVEEEVARLILYITRKHAAGAPTFARVVFTVNKHSLSVRHNRVCPQCENQQYKIIWHEHKQNLQFQSNYKHKYYGIFSQSKSCGTRDTAVASKRLWNNNRF
jgi:hypothetical protein